MNKLVISLKRAVDRRNAIINHFAANNVSFEFLDAVDGKVFNREYSNIEITKGKTRIGQYMRNTEIACTMSHINAIKKAKEENWPYFVVFEDDVIVAEDFNARLKLALRMVPNGWEHIYLSGHPYEVIDDMKMYLMNVYPSMVFSGTHAIVWNSNVYDKMIEEFKKFETTTDDIVMHMVHEKRLNSYMVLPFMSAAIPDAKSMIDEKAGECNIRKRSMMYFRNRL